MRYKYMFFFFLAVAVNLQGCMFVLVIFFFFFVNCVVFNGSISYVKVPLPFVNNKHTYTKKKKTENQKAPI